jgi:hypothetical protein
LEPLHGRVVDVGRDGFLKTMDVSCWSFMWMAHLDERSSRLDRAAELFGLDVANGLKRGGNVAPHPADPAEFCRAAGLPSHEPLSGQSACPSLAQKAEAESSWVQEGLRSGRLLKRPAEPLPWYDQATFSVQHRLRL